MRFHTATAALAPSSATLGSELSGRAPPRAFSAWMGFGPAPAASDAPTSIAAMLNAIPPKVLSDPKTGNLPGAVGMTR